MSEQSRSRKFKCHVCKIEMTGFDQWLLHKEDHVSMTGAWFAPRLADHPEKSPL